MGILDGSTIFWLIALGMFLGGTIKLIMWKSAVSILQNVVTGAVVAVIVGTLFGLVGMAQIMLLSFICIIALLFALNVFNMGSQAT